MFWKIFGAGLTGGNKLPSESIREFSDAQLLEVLEKNEETDLKLLTVVCSEILRRKEKWKIN